MDGQELVLQRFSPSRPFLVFFAVSFKEVFLSGSTAKPSLCLSGYVARKAFAYSMVVMPASRMSTTSRCCRVPQRRSTRPFACAERDLQRLGVQDIQGFPELCESDSVALKFLFGGKLP